MPNTVNDAGTDALFCAEPVPKRTHQPNQVARDIRTFERWMAEDAATWPPELQALAQVKLMSLQMRDQENLPPVMERENLKDIEAFDIAHAAFIASKGA